MALKKFGDRVREVTDTQGSSEYHLNGTSDPLERTFVVGVGDGEYCDYCCEGLDDWEIGYGKITADPGGQGYDTLTREVIYASSNNNEHVAWGAGDKTIFNTATARALDHIAGFVINKSEISFNRKKFVATAGQTDFEFIYLRGSIEVRLNGLVLTEDQVVASDGENFSIAACSDGDVVEAMAIGQYSTTHSEITTPVPTGQVFKSGIYINNVWRNLSGPVDGIASNCTRTTSKSGVDGDSVLFDGTSSHVDFIDLGLDHSSPFTIAFWYTTASSLADGTILSNQSVDDSDGYLHIRTTAAGLLEVALLDSSGTEQSVSTPISASTEYHIAVTYDGTSLTLWADGTKGTPLATSAKTTTVTNDLCLGYRLYPSASAYCAGVLCGINVYATALSDSQIEDIYSEPDEPDVTTLGAIVVPGGSVATNEDIIAMVIALG
jgi:hypothetical protein